MNLFDSVATKPIATVPMPPDAEFRTRFLATRTPAVFDNVAAQLPIAREWSFDYFASRLEHIRIQRPADDGLYHYLGFERVPFDHFRAMLKASNRAYAFEPLIDPAVKREVATGQAPSGDDRLPGFIAMERLYSSNLWIGSGGNKSLLHFDHVNSLLVMVEGHKRFVLFGPEQTQRMYPYSPMDFKAIRQGRVLDSQVNADRLDLQRFPKLRDAEGLRGELHPGQALFIPAGTWHFIESQGLNVAVNYFWFETPLRNWLERPLRDYLAKRCVVLTMDHLRKLRHRLRRVTQPRAGTSP